MTGAGVLIGFDIHFIRFLLRLNESFWCGLVWRKKNTVIIIARSFWSGIVV